MIKRGGYEDYLRQGEKKIKRKMIKIRKNNGDVLCISRKSIIFAEWYQINGRLFEPVLQF